MRQEAAGWGFPDEMAEANERRTDTVGLHFSTWNSSVGSVAMRVALCRSSPALQQLPLRAYDLAILQRWSVPDLVTFLP